MKCFNLIFLALCLSAVSVLGDNEGTHDHTHDDDDESSGRSCSGHSKSSELMSSDAEYHGKWKTEKRHGDKMVHKMKKVYKDHTFRKTVNQPGVDSDSSDEELEKRRLLAEYDQLIKIPIVFHVLYSNDDENLSDDQLASQISVLNKDFRGTNSEISDGEIDSIFEDRVGDSKLEFYIAGTERVSISSGICDSESTMKRSSGGGSDGWDASKYLNIWICTISGLGYAYYPCLLGTSSEYMDGVAIHSGAVGSTNDDANNDFYFAYSSYNEGRTATHEIGHYLNLMHIWGDSSSCSSDDGVDDTPTSYSSNFGCPSSSTDTCDSIDSETGTDLRDNYENYMDYSDDACMFMFTEEQVIRMRSVVSSSGCRSEMFSNGGGTGTTTDTSDTSDSSDDTNDGELYCDDGCSLPEDYVSDNYCDCSECEDEDDWTCSSCGSADGTCDDQLNDCGDYIYCDGITDDSTSTDSTSTDTSTDDSTDDFTCNDGCVIPSYYANDGYYCDCSDCGDEEDISCNSCGNTYGQTCDTDITYCGDYISCTGGSSKSGAAMDTNGGDSSNSDSNNNNSDNSTNTGIIIAAVAISVLLIIVIAAYFVKRKWYSANNFTNDDGGNLLENSYVPPATVTTM